MKPTTVTVGDLLAELSAVTGTGRMHAEGLLAATMKEIGAEIIEGWRGLPSVSVAAADKIIGQHETEAQKVRLAAEQRAAIHAARKSWQLRQRGSFLELFDPASGDTELVNPRDGLSPSQQRKLAESGA